MKLVTSLLLGSAAGLAAVAGAQAADLPFRKAAPVDYVRVCDWVGQAGYFYIPGTDTCIKLGGEVRFEYAYVEPSRSFTPTPFATLLGSPGTVTPGKAKSASGFFTRGKIEADVRTQTAYGLLRAFVRLQADRDSGNYGGPAGAQITSAYIDKAYITFAGITAGRVQSFFDFYADDYNYDGIANSDESTQVLAYTATFGGGFSATISAEEPNSGRRAGIGTVAFGNTAIVAPAAVPNVLNGTTVGYGGERIPDAVAQISLTQAWGSAQLSGAYHDVNTIAGGTGAGLVPTFQTATASGFAVQAGVDIKLPMLAAGDELWLEGAYQNGAYLYQDSDVGLNNGFYGSIVGGFQHLDVDAIAIGNTNAAGAPTGSYHLALGEGFSVMGALHHYFTPQFHDVLYGSYEEIGYGNQAKNIAWYRGGLGDASEYRIGNQFIFTPVHNLDIGVDVMYSKINQTLAHDIGPLGVANATTVFNAASGFQSKDPDSFTVRLRLDRNF